MTILRSLDRLSMISQRSRAVLKRFGRHNRGVAAVEFALMVPAMIMVWVGMVVATDALTADKKVTLLTRTLADITTQMQAVSQGDMDSIFQATNSVMWPQPATSMAMRVISLDIDGAGKVFVDWSVVPSDGTLRKPSLPAVARCTNFTAQVPAGLIVPRTSIVMAEVAMDYQASVASQIVDKLFQGTAVNGQMPLGDKLYMRPRQANKVTFNPPPAANCPGYTA